MREPENIRAVEECAIDMMGFIFYPQSPRFVAKKPGYLPDKIRRIGVFVDMSLEDIRSRIAEYGLYGVQLHGNEPPHLCEALRSNGVKVIKAFPIRDRFSLEACRNYEPVCDYFLFDTPTPGYGGAGTTFDWKLLDRYNGKTPFLLSGGIGTENIESFRPFSHSRWAGIDLNSRFETVPALKDVEKLKAFIREFRSIYDNNPTKTITL